MLLNSYQFTIIEDRAVPLTNAPPSGNYSGHVLAAVLVVAVLVIGLVYGLWYRDHRKRIEKLKTNLIQYGAEETDEFHFNLLHPKKLLEAEKFLEQQLAGCFVTEETDI